MPVSYTHLDVYKRQDLKMLRPDKESRLKSLYESFIGRMDEGPVSYTHLDRWG